MSTISREWLEQTQIGLYMIVIFLAVVIGANFSNLSDTFALLISPCMMILMFSMFTQIPFLNLATAFKDRAFMQALLIGNFIIVPLLVYILLLIFPQPPAVVIGLCLVLLTPCIDYVIVFTHLGKGNEKLVLAATPILLVVQLLLLPLYVILFSNGQRIHISVTPFIEAFLLMILLPLVISVGLQLLAKKNHVAQTILDGTGWLPVPLMALVLFVVIASQIAAVLTQWSTFLGVLPIYISFVILMPLVGRLIAKAFRLQIGAGRALLFSLSTRNSLVVLPLAFALPADLARIAATIIVMQTMTEILAELIYIKIIPKLY